MKQIIVGLFIMLLVACNQQPVHVTVKMDTPRDTVYVEKVIHDTIIVGKLNKYEKEIIKALWNNSRKNAINTINQYTYDKFPYKCNNSTIVKRVWGLENNLTDGMYGFVSNDDTLRCDEVKNNTVIKSWEVKRNGTIDTVDESKGKIKITRLK